jgi:hypothetical protein
MRVWVDADSSESALALVSDASRPKRVRFARQLRSHSRGGLGPIRAMNTTRLLPPCRARLKGREMNQVKLRILSSWLGSEQLFTMQPFGVSSRPHLLFRSLRRNS